MVEVETDEQVESSKMLGDEFYEVYREKILKSKPINNLLQYTQWYHQMGTTQAKSEYDEHYLFRTL